MTDIMIIFPAVEQPPIGGWPTQREKYRAGYLLSMVGYGNRLRWLSRNGIATHDIRDHPQHKHIKIYLDRLITTNLIYKFIADHEDFE